ncbi:maestro heat-like repeat-containing protein family member 7 [Parus major]|uniref:maestro heat-like repeat-containing protein family member 7 n=1 Tax=Parus major TaxID=9157 RepID=UPI001443DEDB|nr:maestro heat-like repeat-containing protein family member 7 [Parus major]
MKALFCRLRCDSVVMQMGRKCGWDTLLHADTQHYAVGLLAREMHRDLIPLCSRMACHLLGLLSKSGHRCDLHFLAFLVEVLDCLDLSQCRDSVLEIMSRYLQNECRERRRLALRGLVVLIRDPSTARRIGILSQRLVYVLGDADGEVVRMSLCVFSNVLQHKDILISSTTAPKLAEALLLLFDHDNSHVQVLSIQLFQKMMYLVVDEGKKPLKRTVSQSLLPLFLLCHEENQHVAKASRETLLCASGFLKKRGLKQLIKNEELSKFGKCLVRTAWRSSLSPGLSVWGWQLWPSAVPMGASLSPTHRSLPWATRVPLQAPVAPSRVPMEPRATGVVGWAGTAAPRAAAGPLPPPEPGASGCCPVPQGWAGTGGRGWPQAVPGRGADQQFYS